MNHTELRKLAEDIKDFNFEHRGTGMDAVNMRIFNFVYSHNRTPYISLRAAEWISAANPQRIIELLNEIEALKKSHDESELKQLRVRCSNLEENYRNNYATTVKMAREPLEKELSTLKQQLEVAVGALEYYADEKNWYDVNRHDSGKPVIRMVIGSIDTTGNEWIGGHSARGALSQIKSLERKEDGK